MNSIKAIVDDLEIFNVGKAHLKKDGVLIIEIDKFKIEISYVFDKSLEPEINWSMDNNLLKICFENYIESGGGILNPWQIGSYMGRQLFLTIYSVWLDNGSQQYIMCEYILYLGKEVENESI